MAATLTSSVESIPDWSLGDDSIVIPLTDDERSRALELSPLSYRRPPDWRWRVARCWLGRVYPPDCSDDSIRLAARFQRILHGNANDVARLTLRKLMPGLLDAYELYSEPRSPRHWEIEARLLARQTFAEIAQKCGCSPELVYCYHEFFYHVQPALDARCYILHEVIGYVGAALMENDFEKILKYFAYVGGPALLESVLRHFRHPPVLPEHPEQLSPVELRELRSAFLVKALIVAHTTPTDARFIKEMAVLSDAVEMLRAAQTTEDAPIRVESAVDWISIESNTPAPAKSAVVPSASGGVSILDICRQFMANVA